MRRTLRIGTRGSPLALWQANWVANEIKKRAPLVQIWLIPIKTKGDKILGSSLMREGGKRLFVGEIETALLERRIDLAVHSLKDLPGDIPEGLILGAIPLREDPRDVLVSLGGISFLNLPHGAIIGTSSLRRVCQLRQLRDNLMYRDLRGNVETRLKKLDRRQYDAVVVAWAGLKRLGLEGKVTEFLPIIPAVGQGALVLEIRGDHGWLKKLIAPLDHLQTRLCVMAERAFIRVMGGSCLSPMACHVSPQGSQVEIECFLSDLEAKRVMRKTRRANLEAAQSTVHDLAREMLEEGGREILKELQENH